LAFTTTTVCRSSLSSNSCVVAPNSKRRHTLHSSKIDSNGDGEEHPAVVGWPEKYVNAGGSPGTKDELRVISDDFEVHPAIDSELKTLDVSRWPTWTTGDKPKWDVGNQIVDKEMPYGELSYMMTGTLELIPKSTGVPVLVTPGDLVTFPKGFVASWKVLEELTWHYYLY
jgi:hypothetical protein